MSDKYVITLTPENAMGGCSKEDETIFGYLDDALENPTFRASMKETFFADNVDQAKVILAELLFGNPDSLAPLKLLDEPNGYTTVRYSGEKSVEAILARVRLDESYNRESTFVLKIFEINFMFNQLRTSKEKLSRVVKFKYLGLHKEAIQQTIA